MTVGEVYLVLGYTCKRMKKVTMREKLRSARKAKGMSQKEVADYLNVKVLAYQRIESGQRTGRVDKWDKLEDLFGIHQRELRVND